MKKIELFTYDIGNYSKEQDMSCFSERLQEHISRYTMPRDRLRSYCMYKLLRHALKKDVLDVEFETNGAPTVPGETFVSLSHSGNIVAVALSKDKVSIDIERVSERVLQLNPEKWLTESEKKLYYSLPQKKQIRYLTKIWTEKECYIKFEGKNLTSMFMGGPIDFAKLPLDYNFTAKFIRDIYGNKYCLTICSLGSIYLVAKKVKELD